MDGRAQLERLIVNIRDLGARRLAVLGALSLVVLIGISVATYQLSRPEREVLYAGLDREDVTRIGAALREQGISFDVSADGTAILVAHRDTMQARMRLAEQGLPQGTNSGYELFDDLGSFGLTSFMQEVTRVRALEGELARTIQTMQGITAARVHIVLPDEGSFRREQRPASASVVIRTENDADDEAAQAIRHLVAAAIPGMKLDAVTVLNTEGIVLASGEDAASAATGRLARLQSEFNRETEENIRRTLIPYLGIGNFTVSVASDLNTDKTVANETVFDPDSRVERSVRTLRETAEARNRATDTPTTVQQNIPQEELPDAGGADNTETSERREELTNFEISSRIVETTKDGFEIERLSIAVLVNKDRLMENAGTDAGSVPVDQQLVDIEALVRAAAGASEARQDVVTLAAVGFKDGVGALDPVPPPSLIEAVLRQLGTIINAATILVVAVLLIWFGLRPVVRAVLEKPEAEPEPVPAVVEATEVVAASTTDTATPLDEIEPNLIEDFTSKMNLGTQKRLEQLVEFNVEQAALLMRQWLIQDERI